MAVLNNGNKHALELAELITCCKKSTINPGTGTLETISRGLQNLVSRNRTDSGSIRSRMLGVQQRGQVKAAARDSNYVISCPIYEVTFRELCLREHELDLMVEVDLE